jgi:hypothetical protein
LLGDWLAWRINGGLSPFYCCPHFIASLARSNLIR